MSIKKPATNNTILFGLVIILAVVIILMTVFRSKENLGFRNLIKDDKVRDQQKKECQSKGGNWKRGGDLVTDSIWGPNASCIKYRIDANMMGGYCCYDRINPVRGN